MHQGVKGTHAVNSARTVWLDPFLEARRVHCRCSLVDHLEDGQQRLPERVEVAARFVLIDDEVELASEQLHAEQREDDDEQVQQQEQTGDGPHAVEQ